jgi:polyribonucleotide nucleotidyltransferase
MDFKVAGTADGITALQMDIKITSITKEIMKEALEQANGGRLHILGKMAKAIEEARSQISDYAPAMQTIMIPKEEIRVLIGKGGETIRGLCERFNCSIDIDDDGKVVVASVQRPMVDAAIAHINNMFAVPELDSMHEGTVVTTTDFGAFVSFMGGKEGLVHVSEVVPVRLGHITDALEVGDQVAVKVVDLDDRGKIRLTMKNIEQPEAVADKLAKIVSGTEDGSYKPAERAPREDRGGRDRGGRGGDRGGRGGRDRDRGPRRDGGNRDGGDRGNRRPSRVEE